MQKGKINKAITGYNYWKEEIRARRLWLLWHNEEFLIT